MNQTRTRSFTITNQRFAGRRVSKQKCLLVPITLRKQCAGYKKSRWLLLWTILRRRGQSWEIYSDACREDRCFPEEEHSKFALQKEGLSRRAEGSQRWPILSWKTDRFYDWWTLLGNRHSCGSSRLLWSFQSIFAWSWFSRFWYKMGRSLKENQVPADRILESLYKMRIHGSDRLRNCIGTLRTRYWATYFATELPEIEDHDEEMCRSEDQSPQFLREVKESRQEHRLKAKGNLTALKGSKERMLSVESRRTVHKGRRW